MFNSPSVIIGAIVGGALTAAAFLLLNALVIIPQARFEGRQQYIAERAAEDLKAEAERKKDDASLQSMSSFGLCVMALGRVPDCNAFLQSVR